MNNSERDEDQYEFALVVRHLVRLRQHRGEVVVELAVQEAATYDWRFCEYCRSGESHDPSECVGYGYFKARKTSYGA